MKQQAMLAALLAAALATGCATTRPRYDNNNVNRDRFAGSGQQKSIGSVETFAQNSVERLRVGGSVLIDTEGVHRL